MTWVEAVARPFSGPCREGPVHRCPNFHCVPVIYGLRSVKISGNPWAACANLQGLDLSWNEKLVATDFMAILSEAAAGSCPNLKHLDFE